MCDITSEYVCLESRGKGPMSRVEHAAAQKLATEQRWDGSSSSSSRARCLLRPRTCFSPPLLHNDIFHRLLRDCLEALRANSPDAHVFCLIHKMDLVDASKRRPVYAARVDELRRKSEGTTIRCFGTSIWDETLYKVRALPVLFARHGPTITMRWGEDAH